MGPGLLAAVREGAGRSAQWAAVVLGFSIPISTALDSVLLVIVLAGWLACGAWRAKWEAVRGNGVALAALALFGLLLLGMLYGERNPGDAGATLGKYLDLVLIPLLVFLLRDPAARRRAIHALAASLALVMLASFVIMSDLVPESALITGNSSYPVVFKGRQTHGPLMAFGAFLYCQLALAAATPPLRVLWLTLAAAALINGTLVVQGATGYLVFGVLALYLGYLGTGWRGVAAAAAIAAALVAALAFTPGPFQQRIERIQNEAAQWRPGTWEETSSIGTRLELYRVSVEVFRDRPVLGHGTGSFAKAFAEKTRGRVPKPVRNPHSEYFHWMVQLGLPGIAALIFLFVMHWRLAARLESPLERHLARGLVLTIAAGSLFNTWLMDHTEGLLYAWLTGLLFAGLKSPFTVSRSA